MVIGYDAGGAYDAYARLLVRHMPRHLAGKPDMIPQNMPGAGSLKSVNYLYNVASKDGTVMAVFHERMGLEPRVDPSDKLKYDGRRLTWIGSMANNISACVLWGASGVKTVDDLRGREIIAGASSTVDSAAVFARVSNALLGAKFRLVLGYGSDATNLALERGEIEARCGWGYASLMATRPDWLSQNKINIPVQFSSEPHPMMKNVPTLMSFVKDPADRQALDAMFATQIAARPVAAPPGIPGDRKDALRKAFDDSMKDPALLADAKRARIDISPFAGAEIEKLMTRLYDLPDPIFARIRSFREPQAGERRLKKKAKKKQPS